MKVNKEISQVTRKLFDLGINLKQRRSLVEISYAFLSRVFSFPENLKESIEETNEKMLKGDRAYKYLVKKFEGYDDRAAYILSSADRSTIYGESYSQFFP